MGAKLGGRVIVNGPGMLAGGVVALVTYVHDTGEVDLVSFPRGSSTGLCLNKISTDEREPYHYRPADPEPVGLEIALTQFVDTLKPLVAAAVEDYAVGKDTERK